MGTRKNTLHRTIPSFSTSAISWFEGTRNDARTAADVEQLRAALEAYRTADSGFAAQQADSRLHLAIMDTAHNAVLKQVAQVLAHAVRPFDTVARWGGEEFAVLLTSPLERPDAEAIAERLRVLVAEGEHTVTGLDGMEHQVRVTVSIGVALFPDDAKDAAEIWRRANQALLAAKAPPKNQVVFWKAG